MGNQTIVIIIYCCSAEILNKTTNILRNTVLINDNLVCYC